jgi:hypothetical protein
MERTWAVGDGGDNRVSLIELVNRVVIVQKSILLE